MLIHIRILSEVLFILFCICPEINRGFDWLGNRLDRPVLHWYVTVYFRWIGRLTDQNEQIHAVYNILKLSVKGESKIVGHVSWVIWGATDHT